MKLGRRNIRLDFLQREVWRMSSKLVMSIRHREQQAFEEADYPPQEDRGLSRFATALGATSLLPSAEVSRDSRAVSDDSPGRTGWKCPGPGKRIGVWVTTALCGWEGRPVAD